MRRAIPEKAFLGTGWAYPMALNAVGRVGMATYEDDVAQAIRIILGTNPGERLMRPEFGAGLRDFLFEPINTSTMSLIEMRVRESLIDWEPRIDVLDVQVSAADRAQGKIQIEVPYRIRANNVHYNLVYPYYLQEGPVQ